MPHWHSPLVAHVSAAAGSQAMQVSPGAPQVDSERGVQAAPRQQPPGQETASQTQAPARQRWPAPQGEPLPHWQAPRSEQRSALAGSQAMQTEPRAPHAETERTLQVAPEQQPPAQLVLLHPLQAPSWQVCGDGQASHADPAPPQLESLLPVRQVSPEQQPAQEPESQTHVPPEQRWPEPQLAALPHWHCPLAAQVLARVGSQAEQVEPPAPQAAKDRVRQVTPSQQPAAQEVPSQTQLPDWQR
jgi:hypothetical protein